MKYIVCTTALAVAALVTAAGMAVAVAPSGGTTYSGKTTGHKSSAPIPVKLKVASDGKSLTFTITCMGATYSLKGIKVNAQGGFSKSGKVQGVSLKVSGKFASATKASGKFDSPICFAGKPSFTATRK